MFKYIADIATGEQRTMNDDITNFFEETDISNFVGEVSHVRNQIPSQLNDS